MERLLKIPNIILKLTVLLISILTYLGYFLIYYYLDLRTDQSVMIFVLSWLGILAGVYVIFSWYKLTGTVFSLYTIFMLFFFMFNYGQPLMWAIGIHHPKEVGQASLYTLGAPSSGEIVLSQAIILASILLFHFGAVFCYKGSKKKCENNSVNEQKTGIARLAIYKTSSFLSFIVIPVTFYNVIYKLMISMTYGYRDFYYNDEVVTNIVAFNLIDNMFFPCLIGLLIGSCYKKKIKRIVYITFALYMAISILAGDRGSWLYKLIILIWMSHAYHKPLNFKRVFLYVVIALMGLQVLSAIVAVRSSGISFQSILEAFSFKESALISGFFEMGGSMRPTIVLMKYGWNIWPYGNTYLNAILGITTSKTLTFIGIPWEPISDWFSQKYLGISYGAGFSIVAEALINFGPILAPLFMIVLGYIIISAVYLDKSTNINNNPLRVLFAVSTLSIIIHVIRNHFLWIMKSWFYGVVIFMLLILLIKRMYEKHPPMITDLEKTK